MAKSFSFDVVSDYDLSELDHAVDQARRELGNRYDFKGTSAKLEYVDEKREGLKLEGDSEYQIDAIVDMIRAKLAKRNLSQKLIDVTGDSEQAGMIVRKVIPFQKGLDQEKAKKVSKMIRDEFPKAKPQIQGEEVRVTSASKDDLQAVMTMLNKAEFDFPLNFTNFR